MTENGTRRSGRKPPATSGSLVYDGSIYVAFTLKCNNGYRMTYEYEDYISFMNSKGVEVVSYYFELDSLDKLHIHGTFICPRNFYKKKLIKNNWHLKMEEIGSYEDLSRWDAYCMMEFLTEEEEEQMCQRYDVRHSDYPFIE